MLDPLDMVRSKMDLNVQPAPFLWIEEGKGQVYTPRTRKRTKKKKEFVGWGSKQLIAFLDSIDHQTGQQMSQHDITNIINQYINERKLFHPEKKKKVMCDERLHALFGRKSVNRNKVYDLSGEHLAENQVGSDDDLFDSSEEKEGDVSALSKKQKVSSSDKKTLPKKKVVEVSKSCLAAISPENIKLVYLKRTLVHELLRDPENFENKVVGSYVRVKSDPLDIFQKNSHVLQLVTGVKFVTAAGDNSSRTLLQILDMTDHLSISSVSDDDFTKEECDDLRERVKDGLLKQPTVGELEQKVELLHEDITKHWLARELVHLRNLIDQANEKGWRYKVTECLDRRKLLQTPSEQSRLLSEIPKVKPEEVKSETVVEDCPDAVDQEVDDSPKDIHWDWEPCYDSSAKEVMINFSSVPENQENVEIAKRINGHAQSLSMEVKQGLPETEATRAKCNGNVVSFEPRESDFVRKEAMASEIKLDTKPRHMPREEAMPTGNNVHTEPKGIPREEAMGTEVNVHTKPRDIPSEEINVHTRPSIPDHIDLFSSKTITHARKGHLQTPSLQPKDAHGIENSQKKSVEIIDLCDDDEQEGEGETHGGQGKPMTADVLGLSMWHYVDPQGNVQGPFSLNSLKRWKDAKYFKDGFRIWQAGQSPQESVSLADILRCFFRS